VINPPGSAAGAVRCPALTEFPAFAGRRWSVQFDEPELTGDAGLAAVAASGVGDRLLASIAAAVRDGRRAPRHSVAELVAQRVYQIIGGYHDANDCDTMRRDLVVCAAAGRSASAGPLASQPTMTRLENSVSRADLLRIARGIFDHYLDSFGGRAPEMVCIDMDPSAHLTYGQQQLSLFNAHVGGHCLMPFYVFDGINGKIMTAVLRPGKTPTAGEILAILKRLVGAMRARWPAVRILLRADGHHTKPEVMEWLNANGVDFLTGLCKNDALERLFAQDISRARLAYQRKVERKEANPSVTAYACEDYQAGSWSTPERVVARVIVSRMGVDVRYVVTSFRQAGARYLYETVYCGRGNAELFIKECKLGMGSDRSSCSRAEANQLRLLLHAAAYAVLHRFREKVLRDTPWQRSTLAEIRLRVIKVAGRLEVFAKRVKLHLGEALEPVLGAVWRAAAACRAGSGG